MLDYLDVVDRTATGERISEKEYDLNVFRCVQELVRELRLKPDPEKPVSDDDSLADAVFNAGVTLASRIGVYCLDTSRVFKVSEDEVIDAINEIPREITVGADREARTVIARRPDDGRVPHFTGVGATPLSEELYVRIMQSVVSQPIDSSGCSSLYSISGRRIVGMPLEVFATRRAVEWTREANRMVGKPGRYVECYPLNMKAYVIHSVLDPEHIRKTDGVSCAHLPEGFKLQYDVLTASNTAHEYGCISRGSTAGMVGMYAGGPEGVAIHNISGALLDRVILGSDFELLEVNDARDIQLNEVPEIFWAKSLMGQALSRNTNVKFIGCCEAGSEPGCEEWFLQGTQLTLAWVPSGAPIFYASSRPAAPHRENLGGSLEIKWCIDIARAATKLKREEANEIVKKLTVLLPKKRLAEGQIKGKTFEETYDTTTLKPKEEHKELYRRMRTRISDLGVPLDVT